VVNVPAAGPTLKFTVTIAVSLPFTVPSLQVIALPLELHVPGVVLTDPRMKFSGSVVSWLPAHSVVVVG